MTDKREKKNLEKKEVLRGASSIPELTLGTCRVMWCPTYAEFAFCCISLSYVLWSHKVHWLHCHSRWPSKDCERRRGKQSKGRPISLQGMMMWSCCRPDTVISHHKLQCATSTEVKLVGQVQTGGQRAFIPSNYLEETRRILTRSVILYVPVRKRAFRDWGKLKPGSVCSHFVLLWLLSLSLPPLALS